MTRWKWFAIKGFTLQAVLCSFPKVTSGLLAGSSGSCAGGLESADGPAICSTCSLAASGLLQFIALLNKICFELCSIWNYWHTIPFFFFFLPVIQSEMWSERRVPTSAALAQLEKRALWSKNITVLLVAIKQIPRGWTTGLHNSPVPFIRHSAWMHGLYSPGVAWNLLI